MLNRLRLEGFKSWEDTGDIHLAPITCLFGSNSSGKSSILQALLLLKQTAASRDPGLPLHFGDPTTLVNLGDYASIVHNHQNNSRISISLEWDQERRARPASSIISTPHNNYSTIHFGVTFAPISKQTIPSPVVDRFAYTLTGPNGSTTVGIRRQPRSSEYTIFTEPSEDPDQSDGIRRRDSTPTNFYGFPFDIRQYRESGRLAYDCERQLDRLLSDIRYLGPLRAHPMREYTWSGDSPLDPGYAGERTIHALLSTTNPPGRPRSNRLRRSRPISENHVAKWLQDLGLIHSFTVDRLVEGRPYFEVKVKKSANSPEVLLADVGFGVSQILPVLVLCLMAPRHSTIILEQPELHLHPAVQAALADVLIDAAKSRNVQILIESHSEHLLRRLQRRVAEATTATEEDVALYFCKNEGESSSITRLDIDTYGNITNWPNDFFGDDFEEIAATSKAGLMRKLKEEAG